MRHASLFTGIGGFDLAAQWMGWQNVFQVEIDEWCQKLLTKRFPDTAKHTDIKQFDARHYNGAVDIISGGFPCQPYSTAGKRLGTEDDRHLWPEMLRVIREVQPTYVVGENVRGLVNWNGGLVFEEVQSNLEAEGYEVMPFLLPACAVNAPHRRDRVWFIAANTNGIRLERGLHTKNRQAAVWHKFEQLYGRSNPMDAWKDFPTESPVYFADDGIPDRLARLKAIGNAIVPQVAFQIFKAIILTEEKFTTWKQN